MDWSNIERDVVLRTDSHTQRRFDYLNGVGADTQRPHKISKLLDGILSSKLMLEDKPTPIREVKSSFDENFNQHHPLLKALLGDLAELQSSLRVQANKLEHFEGSCLKLDHETVSFKKNQEILFNRVDHIESGLQGKTSEYDVVDLYHDMQLRLKRVESNLEGLEENSRMYHVQFATKDAFSKLLDTIFDQLKTLSSTVELSKDQCTHASILFDALANAFVLLNGDDNRHQLELVTSFSRDINKEHLSKILTDALMRSVDGSIQAHLKPAMGIMHSSILELINEMRERQDAFSNSMRSNFGQLSRQFQDEKLNPADFVPRHMLPPAPAEPKIDPGFLTEFAQMKEQMEALMADNKSLRESLEEQSNLLSDLTTATEETKSLDAEQLLKLKSQFEGVEHEIFALRQDFSVVQTDCREVQSDCELLQQGMRGLASAQEGTEKRLTALEASFAEKLQTVQISMKDNYVEFSTRLNTKTDLTHFHRESEDLQAQCKQHAVALRNAQNDLATRATKLELDTVQSKTDVVASDLNILQNDVVTLDKKLLTRLKIHDDDIDELRKLNVEAAETASKLTKRVDLNETTLLSRVNNLGTELHHKVADCVETVGRLARRVDALDTDVQTGSVSLRETQVKLQTQTDSLTDLTRRVNLLDTSCSSQMQSLSFTQKSNLDETAEALAKLSRKLDLNTAEMQSKFNIRSDRVDTQLAQNQESMSKLVDRLELSEHKQLAQLEELSTELRGKISGGLDFSAQLNRRFETHQGDAVAKMSTMQADLVALGKAINERINQVIKQTDANIELTTSQLTTKHSEVAHKVNSLGDSLAHLAQQQYDLCSLQEKQQLDLSNLAAEIITVKVKLDEKLSSSVTTMQSNLNIHTKGHQAALAEEKYDLLQLTSRVALVEQLIRYGQDLEDYNAGSTGTGTGTGTGGGTSPTGDKKQQQLAPRPADPEVRLRLKELKEGLDLVRIEASASRTEFDSRLDAFKAALAALRSQYEDEIEEIKESTESDQKKATRSEQVLKSLQEQIDVLQEEVQEMSQTLEDAGAYKSGKSPAKVSFAVQSKPATTVASTNQADTFAQFSALAEKVSEPPLLQANVQKPPSKQSFGAKSLSFHSNDANSSPASPAKLTPVSSPTKPSLASLRAAMSGSAPTETRTPPRPSTLSAATADDNSFDEGSSFEGSDVFPLSPLSPKSPGAWGSNKNKPVHQPVEEEGVSAFSPGSIVSPPAKGGKLSIQTGVGAGRDFAAPLSGSAHSAAVPDTPDSPWDVDSEPDEDSPARQNFRSHSATSAQSGSEKASLDDDSSSVDSEVRVRRTASPPKASASAGVATKSNPPNIQGPSTGAGAGSGKSPGKPLLSGSLLRSGRSAGPNLGGSYK